jgi:hypothetical protein
MITGDLRYRSRRSCPCGLDHLRRFPDLSPPIIEEIRRMPTVSEATGDQDLAASEDEVPTGEFVGHLNSAGADKRLDKSSDRLFPKL